MKGGGRGEGEGWEEDEKEMGEGGGEDRRVEWNKLYCIKFPLYLSRKAPNKVCSTFPVT